MKAKSKSQLLNLSAFSFAEFTALAEMSSDERTKAIQRKTQDKWTKEDVTSITKMTLKEELVAILLFLFGVPGSVFSIPVLVCIVGFITGSFSKTILGALLILIPLALVPVHFNRSMLSSWYALQILRYFSFKGVFAEPILENKPYILVAPPHGVFPFGNIVTMISFPSLMGFSFKGLAASAALQMPVFRQILCTIGVIDASRKSATKVQYENRIGCKANTLDLIPSLQT
jgi:hypothetical protein